MYRCGDLFIGLDNDIYMLSQTSGSRVSLIGIHDGSNRWAENVKVADSNNITKNEFKIISNNEEFEYLGNIEDIFDIKKVIKNYKDKEKEYYAGDIFEIEGHEYILAKIDRNTLRLINTKSGQRFNDADLNSGSCKTSDIKKYLRDTNFKYIGRSCGVVLIGK